MYFFPQLRTEAFIQYPVQRGRSYRTVQSLDGEMRPIKSSDVAERRSRWTVRLRGLTDVERQTIEVFCLQIGGRLQLFTFMDPFDNLLQWSEDYSNPTWHKDAGLVLTGQQPDPYGGTAAFTVSNPTNNTLRLYQTLPLACRYQLTSTFYSRSSSPVSIAPLLGPLANASLLPGTVLSEWTRMTARNVPETQGEQLITGIELGPNSEVNIFGFQLEPSVAPTGYKVTQTSAGVYTSCRLETDTLRWDTEGVNSHSTDLTVVTV